MLNTPLSDVDHVARPVVAIGTDYRPGTLLDFHTHRRAQFLYGMTGVMEVNTDDGTWMVPPYSGVWLPAGKRHQVRMNGVSTRSLYIEPHVAPRTSRNCEVLVVTPLLHHLLLASATSPRSMTKTAATVPWLNYSYTNWNRLRPCHYLRPCPTTSHSPACAESSSASRAFTLFRRSGRGSCIAVSAPSIACSVSRPDSPLVYGANKPV